MNPLKILFSLTIITLLTSCAAGYKPVNPANTTYYSTNVIPEATISYKHDILKGKYSRKEDRKNIRLVAVKITNTSTNDLVFGKDLLLTNEEGKTLSVLDPDSVYKSLKQLPGTHFLYLLLTPINFYTYDTDRYGNQIVTSSTPIGYVIGPGLSLGNFLVARKTNIKFKQHLSENYLDNRTIKPGETIHGFVGIKAIKKEILTLKRN